MLAHRIFAVGGGSRVLYTAVPLTAWQTTFSWLATHASINLLFSVEGAMLALAQNHDAVVCRIGRQFRLLVSNTTTLVSISVDAFSDDPDDIETALNNLCDQARMQWTPRNDKMSILWCDLLAVGAGIDANIPNYVAKRLNVKVEAAPVEILPNGEQQNHTAASFMMRALSWRNALNPTLDRVASASDRFGLPIAALTALCGGGLLAVSLYWAAQSVQMSNREAAAQNEITKLDQQNGKYAEAPKKLLAPYDKTTGFLDKLNTALVSPDPLNFLNDLKKASDQRVRIMRVRLLGGSFRVDGVPYTDVGSDRTLSAFLTAMQERGYQMKAEDPGAQSQQTGFFSYSISRAAPMSGGQQ
jgi:hypothetical protein